LGEVTTPRALRRSVSIVVFTASAIFGAFMTRYGILWPMLIAFAVFIAALPILMQPTDETRARANLTILTT